MLCSLFLQNYFKKTRNKHNYFFRTVFYQIPLSDWLTSGLYETVTTHRCFYATTTLDANNIG